MKLQPIAAGLALLGSFPLPVLAQAQMETVVVSATRFAEADPRVPANVTVVGPQEIHNTPALTVADVLKSQTGIELRPLYGPLGIDATIDLRGFGDTATSNTLVLLDGQRLNPADLSAINWSAIPLNSVERIEIVRGSGTVLFGDRATGGVINIITDKSGKPQASVSASAGSHGFRGGDASFAGGSNGSYFRLYGHYAESEGFRVNSQQDERSVGGRVGRAGGFGDVFMDYAVFKNSNGLPGALSRAQYNADPSQARSAFNTQFREGYRLRPGVALDLGPAVTLQAEVGVVHENQGFNSTTFVSSRDRDTFSLTPRLRWRHGIGGLPSETVGGIDWYRDDVDSDTISSFTGPNLQTARQTSSAIYLQNVTDLARNLHLTLGVRHQRMNQDATDRAAAMTGETTRSQDAYDVGLSYEPMAGTRVYGRIGRTFRFASTDELFGFDLNFNPVFRGDLLPQHGTVQELGASWRGGPVQVQGSVYALRLKDEIGLDSTTFTNVNFPATRRNGGELEVRWQVAQRLQAKLGVAYTEARFTEGTYNGKWVPMVPKWKSTLAVHWDGGQYGSYSAVVNNVGSRYYSGDLSNALGKAAGYTTVDLKAEWNTKPWVLAAAVLNAFDRKYAPYAVISGGAPFYYPADPRTVLLTARYGFR